MSGADGQRRDPGLHRVSRSVQHHPRTRERRHPLPSRRLARRGHRARRVDDVEVRRRTHSVRRRQGRRHLRSEQDVAPRARGAHAPVRRRDHRGDRPRKGRPRPGRQHQRAGDGVDHGHLLHARRPHGDGGGDRQAARDGRLARAPRSHRSRRHDRDAGIGQARRLRHQGRDGRDAGFRERRLRFGDAPGRVRRADSRRHRLEGRRLQPKGPRDRQARRLRRRAQDGGRFPWRPSR